MRSPVPLIAVDRPLTVNFVLIERRGGGHEEQLFDDPEAAMAHFDAATGVMMRFEKARKVKSAERVEQVRSWDRISIKTVGGWEDVDALPAHLAQVLWTPPTALPDGTHYFVDILEEEPRPPLVEHRVRIPVVDEASARAETERLRAEGYKITPESAPQAIGNASFAIVDGRGQLEVELVRPRPPVLTRRQELHSSAAAAAEAAAQYLETGVATRVTGIDWSAPMRSEDLPELVEQRRVVAVTTGTDVSRSVASLEAPSLATALRIRRRRVRYAPLSPAGGTGVDDRRPTAERSAGDIGSTSGIGNSGGTGPRATDERAAGPDGAPGSAPGAGAGTDGTPGSTARPGQAATPRSHRARGLGRGGGSGRGATPGGHGL